MRKLIYTLLLIALVPFLAGCLGPKPVVQDYSLHPPEAGSDAPYKVEVLLANAGPGGGEVVVEVDLSNRRTGEIVAQEIRELDLQKDQTVRTLVELALPPSLQNLDPENIEVRVDAHYPIE